MSPIQMVIAEELKGDISCSSVILFQHVVSLSRKNTSVAALKSQM